MHLFWRFCLVLILPSLVSALFADEAFQIDYQHALLGVPSAGNTLFHQPSATSKASLIYVLSEKNVLGALNPKDGSVVWRQQLAEPDQAVHSRAILRAVNNTNLIYTAIGSKVSSWDASNGRLVAEWSGNGVVKSMELHEVDPLVVFEGDGMSKLVRLNSANAKMMWEVKDASGEIPICLTTSSERVYYLSLVSTLLKGHQIKVTEVDPFSARPGVQTTLDSQDEVSSIDSIVHVGSGTGYPLIVWTDKTLKTLKLNVLGKPSITSVNIAKLNGQAPERLTVHAPIGAKASGHFLVAYHTKGAHWAEVYHINVSGGAIKKLYDIPALAGQGAFSISEASGQVFFVRHSETEVSVYSPESDSVQESWRIETKPSPAPSQPLASRSAIVEVMPKGLKKYAVRSMLVLNSGDVALIRNGVHDWTRSESLAGIVGATWAEVPEIANLAQALESEIHGNFVSAYFNRVARHIKDLQHLSGWIATLPQRVLSSFGLSNSNNQENIAKDSFGFRKLVIVATKSGRVAAIDTGSHGQILWNVQAIELADNDSWNVKHILVQGDLIWAVADNVGRSRFLTLSGEIKNDRPFSAIGDDSRVVPVSTVASSYLVAVSEDGVPDFKSSPTGDISVTFVTKRKDGSISGWTSAGDHAIKTWDFVPPAGHEIAAITTRPDHDPIASIGRALGDRNVLYKFLSPNLLLVVTVCVQTSTALATVLDSVSGQVLTSAEHKNVDTSKGVSAVFSENWLAYVLQSDPVLEGVVPQGKSKSSILTIMELYESSVLNDRGPLGPNGNFSSLDTASHAPYVETASYILSNIITNITTTSTKQGIVPRSILAYVSSLAAVVAIPVGVFSPRRPVGREPTANEREEGLFKYLPVVDINPTWTLSHQREVIGIREIISAPSDMESTSLVFSYGDLDIFGTRTAPIGSFDMLGKSFNKVQLILTVVALAIGTAILAPMVRKKQIDGLWRA